MPASRLSTSSRRSSSAFRRAAFGSVLTSLADTIAKRRLPATFTVTWSRPSDRFVIVPSPYATSRIVALEQQIQDSVTGTSHTPPTRTPRSFPDTTQRRTVSWSTPMDSATSEMRRARRSVSALADDGHQLDRARSR
jgi:hypothetical protein